jgi:maleate cis-trans isomerase
MFGRRARIGVLVPPGNPTVEPELYRMAPDGVSVHFARLQAPPADGPAGGAAGMEERTRAYRDGLDGPAAALGQVHPAVIVLAHTASSYALGVGQEQPLVDRVTRLGGAPALLAAHAVRDALRHLQVTRLALGTPYPEAISRQGRAYWEASGFRIVGYHRLADVTDIYAESEERAYRLAQQADAPDAQAVLLSGTGLPTVAVLEALERDLGNPVISSNQACLWRALRLAGVRDAVSGFGRLLREP